MFRPVGLTNCSTRHSGAQQAVERPARESRLLAELDGVGGEGSMAVSCGLSLTPASSAFQDGVVPASLRSTRIELPLLESHAIRVQRVSFRLLVLAAENAAFAVEACHEAWPLG